MKAVKCREGEYERGYIPIVSDTYDIAERLKEIDPSFFVMFNTKTQRYEVHCSWQQDTSYACTIPYDKLDARVLEYVQAYRRERLDAIAREVEAYNESMRVKSEQTTLDMAAYKTKQAFRYLDNNSKTDDIPQELINE